MGEPTGPLPALISNLADTEPHTFTPLRYQIAYQALRTKAYAAALPILDNDIYRFHDENASKTEGSSPPQSGNPFGAPNPSSIRYHEVVAYFLYGGMIYLAVGQYDRAILFLELAALYPAANTASKIQVEAYKKWILVNLLHKGKLPSLSRSLIGQHGRILNVMAKPYETVAEVFKGVNFQRLSATVDAGKAIWSEDCNVGLITLVLRAHQRFAISHLSKIYQSIPISKIHELAFPPSTTHNEVYEYVANLIALGQLSATLTAPGSDSSTAFLRFVTPAIEGAEVEKQRVQLALKQQAKIEVLNEYVKHMTHTLQLTRPYLEALSKSKKKTAGADGTSNGAAKSMGGPGSHLFAEDEDEYLENL